MTDPRAAVEATWVPPHGMRARPLGRSQEARPVLPVHGQVDLLPDGRWRRAVLRPVEHVDDHERPVRVSPAHRDVPTGGGEVDGRTPLPAVPGLHRVVLRLPLRARQVPGVFHGVAAIEP